MVSEADILEALRNSPTLKVLLDLPRRVATLEQRLAELQQQGLKPSGPLGERCPICPGSLRIIDEQNHPIFGMMGVKVRTLVCDSCGKQVTRDWDPDRS